MERMSEVEFSERFRARARAAGRPSSATIELTYGCNLRCVHCYNPTHRVSPRELTTAEAASILSQIADLGVLNLTFTGGETLTRPDAFEIFGEAKRLGFVLSLITNATRGSFAPFRRGLAVLAEANVPAVVRMPVMTLNAHEIRDAKGLAERHGFRFQYCLEIHPRTDGDLTPLDYRLAAHDKLRVDESMLGGDGADRECRQPAPFGEGTFIDCACGRDQFAITPYGEMNLCVAFPIPKYDLRTGRVEDGWELLKRTVGGASPNERYECPDCELRPLCRQGRNDAWLETGDMSACLPHFKDLARLESRRHAERERR
jgi:radical SAM protein with 4Fe4S-binding SPASM domain